MTSPSIAAGVTSPLDNMSSQALVSLLQRREEQNRRLLENWRAERAHLEASRARAEEVYREERAIMDDERMIWVQEKTKLEKDLDEWKKRAATAEKERDQMASWLKGTLRKESQKGKSLDGATDAIIGSIRGGGLGSPGTHPQSASKFWTPSDGPSPNTTVPSTLRGPTMPESEPFIPLDPRMQSSSPGVVSPQVQSQRLPSIDIQEVIPELEGIRVRPDAVQKTTFTDRKPPLPLAGPNKLSPLAAEREPARARAMSGELTKEALQAPESDRLTMHAGHTPNHSMSLSRLHTVESTEVTNTAGSSGASTPRSSSPKGGQTNAPEESQHSQVTHIGGAPETSEAPDVRCEPEADILGPAAILVPQDDPELKGPLHLRNFPAADEPFFRVLSDRLEHDDMTPTVLKHEQLGEPQQCVELEAGPIAKAGGDGAHDAHEEPPEDDEIEEVIPLKLKKSSNFGAPLGQLRKSSGF